jgi:hypothetical protein
VEIGPAHLISAGRRVLVGHGPPAKWLVPRAGALGRPSLPGTETPCHPQMPIVPPFSRPLPPLVPIGHCLSFTCRPTCAHVRRHPYPLIYRSQVHLLLLTASPHSATAIPTSLCTEGRRQVAAPPVPPATVLMCHRCLESGLVPASGCAIVMCL